MLDTRISDKLFDEASRLMPGGVNSPVRAFRAVGRNPLFIKSARGSKVYDEDGNALIDYVCSWGPGILGHARPEVVKAVQDAAAGGLSFGAPTRGESELAGIIMSLMPAIEMLRMVSSGTEAVMSAIRAARGYTGRDLVVKFTGCYHGHSDGLLVKAGSGLITNSAPDSAGVPKGYTDNTLIAEYNDENSVRRLFEEHPGDIACVIVEPVAANMGVVPPSELTAGQKRQGFLHFLRDITEKNGSVLIFDEVITGFRLSLGGAEEYFDIRPDMVTLGKIVGGGMPIGVYGGRREIMQCVSPLGRVYQAGTLSGNPVAVAAGIAMLKILMDDPDIYRRIDLKAARLEAAFRELSGKLCGQKTAKKTNAAETGHAGAATELTGGAKDAAGGRAGLTVNRVGSLMSVFMTPAPVTDYKSAAVSDTARYARYFNHMLDNGIYVAPSQFEAMFISDAHTDEDIETTCRVISEWDGI